ncbi:MAG TPA: putative Ig domain-containing protein [Candidatus Nanoarchaeia archaeon]|nr:putative Ig domain-containing protein [Candidatus Nanoarchaeia archaeon]
MKAFKLLGVLLLTLLLAASATAEVSWIQEDEGIKYFSWKDGSASQSIYFGAPVTFATGYFYSTTQQAHLTVTVVDKKTNTVVSTIFSGNVNTPGYNLKEFTIDSSHYKKSGEYFIVVKIRDQNSFGDVDEESDYLYLKVKPNYITEIGPFPFPTDDNEEPEMDNIPDQPAVENEQLKFTVSADDEENDELEYEAQVCTNPLGSLCFSGWEPLDVQADGYSGASLNKNTGEFKWKPSYDFVEHTKLQVLLGLSRKIDFRFSAVEADDQDQNSDWERVTITVKDKNRNPKFSFLSNKTVQEEKLLQFALKAADADDDDLEYSILTASPSLPGASLDKNTGVFKWAPHDGEAGVYSVTFKVVDKLGTKYFGGKDIKTITITVTEKPAEPQCGDGADNDGDTLVDENDPGCHTDNDPNNSGTYDPTDNDETDQPVEEPQCDDGLDNDGDGVIDENDPGCHTDGDPADGDETYNPDDNNETDDPEDKPQCDDDFDNDGDGFVDLHDVGCEDEDDDDETDQPHVPVCNDGLDNDGDGKIDFGTNPDNDPGCVDAGDEFEEDQNLPECNDHSDNDGDELVDGNDPGCDNLDDNDETDDPEEDKPQCSDGLDNDHDSKTDYPADPGCSSPEDDDEFRLFPVQEEEYSPFLNLKLQSVHLEEEVQAGSTLFVNVRVFNNGDFDLENLKVQAKIYDLGVMGSTGKFSLDSDQGTNKNVFVYLPEDAEPGLYLVKVTVGNDHYHTSAYRLVLIGSVWNTLG